MLGPKTIFISGQDKFYHLALKLDVRMIYKSASRWGAYTRVPF